MNEKHVSSVQLSRTGLPKMLELVVGQLRALDLPIVERGEVELDPTTRLVEDLGLDSFAFLDLTVLLEQALGLEEFPMQAWVDGEVEAQRPLTIATLAEGCLEAITNGARTS
jgi:acyl carrier protein